VAPAKAIDVVIANCEVFTGWLSNVRLAISHQLSDQVGE
jgi:hypothetical protein